MIETKYQGGHAYCGTCKATFPRSWFRTRDAVHNRDGFDFCSKRCEGNNEGQASAPALAANQPGIG